MEEKTKKTFIIEINGIKEATENVEKLIDALDKLDIKVKNPVPWDLQSQG